MGNTFDGNKFNDLERLERAEEFARFGHWEFNLTDRTVAASKGAWKIYGTSKKLNTIADIQKIPLISYRAGLDIALKQLIEEKKPYDQTFKIKRPNDGQIRDIHSVAEYDKEKNIVFGVIQDITDIKAKERLIKKQDQDFKFIAENTNDVIWTMNIEGKINYISPSIFKLRGFYPHEIIGRNFKDFLLNDSVTRAHNLLKDFIGDLERGQPQKESIVEVFEQPTSNGGNIWTEAVISPIYHENGDFRVFLGVSRNITERISTEQALRESEERYRSLVDNSPDGIAINKNGKIAYINKYAVKILGGTKKSQFIGKSVLEVVKKDNHPAVIERMKKMLKGDPVKYPVNDVYVKLDGSEIPVEVYASLVDYEGEKAIQIIARDNRERLESHKALMESEAKYRTITENFPNGMISTLNDEGEFTFAEGQIMRELGLTKHFLIGKHYKSILSEMDLKISKSNERKIKLGQQVYFEVKVNDKFIGNSLVPIIDDQNRIENVIIITTDISDRKKAEQLEKEMFAKLEAEVEKRIKELNEQTTRLKESQRALTYLLEDVNDARNELLQANKNLEAANNDLEAFAYSVSHDLRAPLRHIDGFSKLLENKIKDPAEDVSKYFNKIHDASLRMHNLINDLLSFSRLGRKKLVITAIDLQNLINEVIKNYEPDIAKRKITWKIKDLPPIRGDFEMIKMAMDNLISNALKFTSKRAHAQIEIGYENTAVDHIEIFIKDNGVGFDNQYAHKLFGVFERLHNSQEFPGTGIGLANVKRIIRSHKGTIKGDGIINKGATFFINLPLNL